MFAELPNELELAVSYQSSKSSYLEACYQFDVVVVDVVAKIKKKLNSELFQEKKAQKETLFF